MLHSELGGRESVEAVMRDLVVVVGKPPSVTIVVRSIEPALEGATGVTYNQVQRRAQGADGAQDDAADEPDGGDHQPRDRDLCTDLVRLEAAVP